jgi:hypothetical protein
MIHAQAYDVPALKCAADAMLLDAGVGLLFHALGTGVTMTEDGRIDSLLIETKRGGTAHVSNLLVAGDAPPRRMRAVCRPY